jgi:hypothetical protein
MRPVHFHARNGKDNGQGLALAFVFDCLVSRTNDRESSVMQSVLLEGAIVKVVAVNLDFSITFRSGCS